MAHTYSFGVGRRRPDVRGVIGVVGEIFITLGVIVFLFLAYELWFTGLYTAHAQADFKKQLQSEWALPLPSPVVSTLPGESPGVSAAPAPAPTFSPGGTQVTCGKCGAKQPGGKFCADCGSPLVAQKKFCASCGIELGAAAKFCANCGTAAASAG